MPWTVSEAWVRWRGWGQWMGLFRATERLHQGQWLAQWERNGTCWGVAEGWGLGFARREKCQLIFSNAFLKCWEGYENLTIYSQTGKLIYLRWPFECLSFHFTCFFTFFLKDFAHLQDLRFQELQELEREKQERRCPSLRWGSSLSRRRICWQKAWYPMI